MWLTHGIEVEYIYIYNSYTMFTSNNRALFHWWWKENLVKHQKVSKYYENGCKSKNVEKHTQRIETKIFSKNFCNWNLFGIYHHCVCQCSVMFQGINIENNKLFFWALEAFPLVSFQQISCLNNFCFSWTSCCNMVISSITKITFLVSTLISKMCTILTNLHAI